MVLRLFFSCAFCWVTSTCAAEVTLPEEQIDRLLQGNFIGCVKVPGWLLGIDGAKILNTSAGAEVSAESRAKAFATERLLSYSMRDALWQSELGGEVIAGISNSFLRSYQFKVRFQGLQPVKVWKGGGSSIRVIVGLPEPEKQIPAVSLEEVKAELRSALTSHPEKIDLAAYLEFCDQSDIPKVVDLLGERMGRYGKGAGATFADVTMLTVYVVGLTPEKRDQYHAGSLRAAEALGVDLRKPSTLIGVTSLARPAFLIEIEAIAVLP